MKKFIAMLLMTSVLTSFSHFNVFAASAGTTRTTGTAGTTRTTGTTGTTGTTRTTGTTGTTGATGYGAPGSTGVTGTAGTTGTTDTSGFSGGRTNNNYRDYQNYGNYGSYNYGNYNNYDNYGGMRQNRQSGGFAGDETSAGMQFEGVYGAGAGGYDEGIYFVQDGDDLWLMMGNIKAKLDTLVYSSPKNSYTQMLEMMLINMMGQNHSGYNTNTNPGFLGSNFTNSLGDMLNEKNSLNLQGSGYRR